MAKKVTTLGMIVRGDKILLGLKKRGFGEGRWNGFGGKVHEGETVEENLIRELQEEIGIVPVEFEEVGQLDFEFEADVDPIETHVYKITEFSGEPTESEEMRPEWFSFDSIPFDQMWADDEYWYPLLLEGKHFHGHFLFDRPSDPTFPGKIISYKLES